MKDIIKIINKMREWKCSGVAFINKEDLISNIENARNSNNFSEVDSQQHNVIKASKDEDDCDTPMSSGQADVHKQLMEWIQGNIDPSTVISIEKDGK